VLRSTLRHIRVPRDLEPITTIRHGAEIDPRDVGVTHAQRDAIWSAVERIYRSGAQPAISLCVRKRGKVIIDRAIGHARGNGPDDGPESPKHLATPDTRFCLASASKAVTAMVVQLLDQHGSLRIDDPVVAYIPEFGAHGKDRITLSDLLTHRAGIPSVPGSRADPEILLDLDRVLPALYGAKPKGRSTRPAYHALSAGYVLGEVVKRATGKTLREVLRESILEPVGIDTMDYGMPGCAEQVAVNYDTGPVLPFPASRVAARALGVQWNEATWLSNHPRFFQEIIPSGNVMTTANAASRFFQLLLQEGELDGVRVFAPQTIRRARTAISRRLVIDSMLFAPVRSGLGLLLGDRLFSFYGPGTPRAFGHPGFFGVLCWGDPQRELAVGLMTTGKALFDPQWRGFAELLVAIGKA
jgi:CubicO group peptidase (beta-lactamase class C family)